MSTFRGETVSASGPGAASPRIMVTAALPGAAAATAANYGSIFTADRKYKVISVSEIHEVVGSNGGAVSLDITRDTGTNAPGAGSSIFASGTFNLKSTANTLQTKSNVTNTTSILAAGNRLGLKDAGTLTAVTGVVVTVVLEAI